MSEESADKEWGRLLSIGFLFLNEDNAVDKYAQLAAHCKELREFILWLTPCADNYPKDFKMPEYKLIGEKAKKLLAKKPEDYQG